MKKVEYQVVAFANGDEQVTIHDTLEMALSHMNEINRMISMSERRSGADVYVGKVEFETNNTDVRDDWEDLNDGYIEIWNPVATQNDQTIALEDLNKKITAAELSVAFVEAQMGSIEMNESLVGLEFDAKLEELESERLKCQNRLDSLWSSRKYWEDMVFDDHQNTLIKECEPER